VRVAEPPWAVASCRIAAEMADDHGHTDLPDRLDLVDDSQ
jgi:hypothetical protein